MTDTLQIRIHGDAALPTLVYLPGLHGDWTLIGGFRAALAGKMRLVEFIYPPTIEWSLNDYANAVEKKLLENGITHGWLIGESFGSQVVWPLVNHGRSFHADGAILAGGFVQHPWPTGVGWTRWIFTHVPLSMLMGIFRVYAVVTRFCLRSSPEIRAGVREFIARRTAADRAAILHRLRLIETNEPARFARGTVVPIRFLAGGFDPVVPWFFVRKWLRRECASYRGSRIIWLADHNVLATASRESAEQILRWLHLE